MEKELTCTLVGSFKYMDLFNQTNDRLTKAGIKILSPQKGKVVGVDNGFKLLDIDQHFPPLEAEMGFLNSLLRSDFGLIINPNGYLGATSVTEIVIAQKYRVPMFAIEQINKDLDPDSFDWQRFCQNMEVCSIEKLLYKINNPKDKIHNLPLENQRTLIHHNTHLEEMAIRVLSADWIKFKGLGYVYNRTQYFYRSLLNLI